MSLKSKLAKKLRSSDKSFRTPDRPFITKIPEKFQKHKKSPKNPTAENQGDEKKPGPVSPHARKISPGPDQSAAHESARKLININKKEPAVRKIIRASMLLADHITPEDTEASARVIREAKEAIHYHYDRDTQRLVATPDFKIRLAATTLERAYAEGTPVQRQIVLTGKFDTDDAIMDKVAGGQEALKAIETLSRLGIKVDYQRETPGDIIEAETFQSDEDSGDD
jgi:hypothetical protein